MAHIDATEVDPTNTEQAKAWDGDEGEYWAAHAERFERSLARYDSALLDAAGIEATSRVLDIGCGTGGTTRQAARIAAAGTAFGVDLSSRMIEVARRLAEQERIGNVRFERADAQIHPFGDGTFDVAISRTGTMFFGDLRAAFTNIARAVRPGGRVALLVWREPSRNEWFLDIATTLTGGRGLPQPPPDAPSPFSMSDHDRVRELLTGAGFGRVRFEARSELMYFGTDADDAFRFITGFSGWMLEGLDEDGRAHALAALRANLEPHVTPDGVLYGSATWLITADRMP